MEDAELHRHLLAPVGTTHLIANHSSKLLDATPELNLVFLYLLGAVSIIDQMKPEVPPTLILNYSNLQLVYFSVEMFLLN